MSEELERQVALLSKKIDLLTAEAKRDRVVNSRAFLLAEMAILRIGSSIRSAAVALLQKASDNDKEMMAEIKDATKSLKEAEDMAAGMRDCFQDVVDES